MCGKYETLFHSTYKAFSILMCRATESYYMLEDVEANSTEQLSEASCFRYICDELCDFRVLHLPRGGNSINF